MRNRKYILDISDLQYKQVKLLWTQKLIRLGIWLAVSIAVSVLYFTLFETYFGSPKERMLNQDIENLKLEYSILDRKFSDAFKTLTYLRQSDDTRFRPILDMDSVPSFYRKPAYGGVDRYREFSSYTNSKLLISAHERLELLKNMSNVQTESFTSVSERAKEWKREMEYLPMICPVDVAITRGDGLKLREVHPVLGTERWHFGQDFNAPYGTEVYATGAGKVVTAGWSPNGFGNHVIIDHGYGYESIYGHLSKINVPIGLNVKRGDLIGLSGNSGTSSGPHLHYQINLNGNHQNALYFFSDDLTPEEYREMIGTLSSKLKFR